MVKRDVVVVVVSIEVKAVRRQLCLSDWTLTDGGI